MNFSPQFKNSLISPQIRRLTFLNRNTVIFNLPTTKIGEFALVKFKNVSEKSDNSDKIIDFESIFRVKFSKNRLHIFNVDWNRDYVELRRNEELIERFFGMGVESYCGDDPGLRRHAFEGQFRNWRKNVLLKLV